MWKTGKVTERWRTAKLVNWQFLQELELTDTGYPIMQPAELPYGVTEFLGFNEVLTCRHPEDKAVHFYLDDYQFERVWAQPERYIEILRRFPAVVMPDFSLYEDYPEPIQRWNHYRNTLLGALFQRRGLVCLPSVNWADDFGWSIEGVPVGGTHVFSTIGCIRDKEHRKELLPDLLRYLALKHPDQLIIYGQTWPELETALRDEGIPWQRFAHGQRRRIDQHLTKIAQEGYNAS